MPVTFTLTSAEQGYLLATARRAIYEPLGLDFEAPPELATETLATPCGAFVTLHLLGRLRGCIGHITAAAPLVETVAQVAASSAFEDPRFPPVTAGEAPRLSIEISALSPFRVVLDATEVTVGEHGVLLRRGHRSGLLLPQVATEQGWDREQFLDHTCIKAGLPVGAWREPGTTIEVFSAFVFGEGKR
jgi:AmmeMemoRadiSam system protein A